MVFHVRTDTSELHAHTQTDTHTHTHTHAHAHTHTQNYLSTVFLMALSVSLPVCVCVCVVCVCVCACVSACSCVRACGSPPKMLNCCIERKRARDESRKASDGGRERERERPPPAGGGENGRRSRGAEGVAPGAGSGVAREASPGKSWDSWSDSEDEFFECLSDQEEGAAAAKEGEAEKGGAGRAKPPDGRLHPHGTLTLLNPPTEPLYIPVTQVRDAHVHRHSLTHTYTQVRVSLSLSLSLSLCLCLCVCVCITDTQYQLGSCSSRSGCLHVKERNGLFPSKKRKRNSNLLCS